MLRFKVFMLAARGGFPCRRISLANRKSRSDGYSRYSHTISKRSMFHSLTRRGNLRRRITNCWRKMRFSASSRACLVNRLHSEQQLGQKRNHRPLLTIRPPARHPGLGFREAQHRARKSRWRRLPSSLSSAYSDPRVSPAEGMNRPRSAALQRMRSSST